MLALLRAPRRRSASWGDPFFGAGRIAVVRYCQMEAGERRRKMGTRRNEKVVERIMEMNCCCSEVVCLDLRCLFVEPARLR